MTKLTENIKLQIIEKKAILNKKKNELINLQLDIGNINKDLKLFYSILDNVNSIKNPDPLVQSNTKKLRNVNYIKCPNGCGSVRKYRKGFKSHLGFGEGAVKNCRKIGTKIKTLEDLNYFFISNNIK